MSAGNAVLRRVSRYLAGALAGLMDLTGNLPARDAILARVARTGDTLDGFDLISDLFLYSPKWQARRSARRRAGRVTTRGRPWNL